MRVRIRVEGSELGAATLVRGRVFAGVRAVADPNAACDAWGDDLDRWTTGLRGWTGSFALVHAGADAVFAAVDRARSIPLFYACAGDTAFVSDDARWVRDGIGGREAPGQEAEEFLLAGFVMGRRTLVEGVHQLLPGEVLRLLLGPGPGRAEVRRYWTFGTGPSTERSPAELEERFDEVLTGCVQRLVEVAGGRTLVVPLSGGNDSRLLLTLLRRAGYPSIRTFTYGRPRNREAVVSERVAQALGVPWHFVPYDHAAWRRWLLSEDRVRYYRMADGLSSLPLQMDVLAVGELRRGGVVPEDSVFVPGLSADVPAGSRSDRYPALYRPGLPPLEELVHVVIRSSFALWDWSDRERELYPAIAARVAEGLGDYGRYSDGGRAFEAWDALERLPKFVVNSVRSYECWGYDWWLPYWDAEFLDFWLDVPLDLRKGRRFYRAFVDRIFSEVTGLPPQATPGTARHGKLGPVGKRLVIGSKLYPLARRAIRMVRSITEYDRHLMAWYGMVPRELVWRTAGWTSVLSFLTAERLGRLDLSGRGSAGRLTEPVA